MGGLGFLVFCFLINLICVPTGHKNLFEVICGQMFIHCRLHRNNQQAGGEGRQRAYRLRAVTSSVGIFFPMFSALRLEKKSTAWFIPVRCIPAAGMWFYFQWENSIADLTRWWSTDPASLSLLKLHCIRRNDDCVLTSYQIILARQ